MDLLNDKIKNVFFKYLLLACGSALITSIYSVVDMAMVGQYHGSSGTAALACVAPLWNIIYSLGLLTGIGGSVLFTSKRVSKNDGSENEYFTTSIIYSIFLALIVWFLFIFLDEPILKFFGCNEDLYELAELYILPIKFVLPLFLFNQMLSAYLRNDNDPTLSTIGVLAGGIFNIFGDYFFVFTCNMGIYGAGLATAIGSIITFIILMFHFFKKKNTLKLIKVNNFLNKVKEISIVGFSTFFIDVAMGILTILFNRQIMSYLGSDALSVYGIIINISTFIQCLAYGVGQASQPIISANFSCNKQNRINETLKYSIIAAIIIGLCWFIYSMILPNSYIYLFMKPTSTILDLAPFIIRVYAISFILLPFNIYLTYYFQAIMQPQISFIISVFRGLIISGCLIILLPLINGNLVWFTMPITELIITLFGVTMLIISNKKLKKLDSLKN